MLSECFNNLFDKTFIRGFRASFIFRQQLFLKLFKHVNTNESLGNTNQLKLIFLEH